MQIWKFGDRSDFPAYFDMACRLGPTNRLPLERGGFRVGDRAGAYAQLAVWRRDNPQSRLTVLEDPYLPNVGKSYELPAKWFARELADCVIEFDEDEEPTFGDLGNPLHSGNVWTPWSEIALNPGDVWVPKLETFYIERGQAKRDLYLVNETSYVTVQPLFDADYDIERNIAIELWQKLCIQLARHVWVVVVGSAKVANRCPVPWPVQPLWCENLHFQETLTVIQEAQVHVGGETGTTLWAPLLRTPTVALYNPRRVYPSGLWWHRPISFGQAVTIHSVDDAIDRIVDTVLNLYQQGRV